MSFSHARATALAMLIFFTSVANAQSTALTLSPAVILYEQAAKYVLDYFDGAISEPLEKTIQLFRDELKQICELDGINCPYPKGSFSVQNLIRSLNEKHSGFVSLERMQALARQNAGAGSNTPELGIRTARIRSSTDRVITEVKIGSAAQEAGLKTGDRLLQINGKNFPSSLGQSEAAIPQTEGGGSPVTLTLRRREQGTLTVSIQPRANDQAELPTLRLLENTNPKAAVLRIPTFTGKGLVAKRVFELMRAAESQSINQMIIDLRGNPGGSAYECPAAASAFVPDVVNTFKGRAVDFKIGFDLGKAFFKDANKDSEIQYVIENPIKYLGKVSVLVNDNSASCSEYMSDHIQIAKRGKIIGEQTAGVSNTVVYRFELVDGTGIQMAVAKAYRQNETPIPDFVTPDIELSWNYGLLADQGRDNMVEAALESMK
jgi:carboxyl-terminal processing protease